MKGTINRPRRNDWVVKMKRITKRLSPASNLTEKNHNNILINNIQEAVYYFCYYCCFLISEIGPDFSNYKYLMSLT